MKNLKVILLFFAIALIQACSKDEDQINLTQTQATYLQSYEPTHHRLVYEYDENSGWMIINDWTSQVYTYFDNLYSSLPDKIKVEIGTHIIKEKESYWIGYNQYYRWKDVEVSDYIYVAYSLEWEESIKDFIIFKGHGLCEVKTERYTKNLVLKKKYVDYSFKGNSELEAKYSAQLKLIDITETKKLDDSEGNKILFNRQYAINSYQGVSSSGADFYLHTETSWVDLYLEPGNIIHAVQTIPNAVDWGLYTNTTESPIL